MESSASSTPSSKLDTFLGATPEIRARNRQFLFSIKGRVGRTTYWLASVLPGAVFLALAAAFDLPARMGYFGFTVFGLLVLWVTLVIAIKRCHDRDRPGWFVLVALIPVIGSIWLLIELGFLEGSKSENRFGSAPV